MSRFLGLSVKEIGQIGGGKRKPTMSVDVAMMQSLSQNGIVDDIVGEYGHLIVDECHHVSAVSFERVVGRSKARYVTGLSATVARKDGHQPIIFMQCGPIRHRVDDRKQAEQRPFDHQVIIRPTSFRLPPELEREESPSIQEIYAVLARDEARNRLIVEDIIAAVKADRSPVLLTERREHLEALASQLAEHVENVIVMTGGMGKKQRQRLAERIAAIPERAAAHHCRHRALPGRRV